MYNYVNRDLIVRLISELNLQFLETLKHITSTANTFNNYLMNYHMMIILFVKYELQYFSKFKKCILSSISGNIYLVFIF
jgi:hypothetical protein